MYRFHRNGVCSFVVLLISLILSLSSIAQDGDKNVKIPKLKQLKQKDIEVAVYPTSKKDGKWGFANEKGRFVIRPVFSSVKPFDHDLSVIEVEGLYGVLNRDATYLFEPQFDKFYDFNYQFNVEIGIAIVVKDGKYGLVNSLGEVLCEPQFDSFIDFKPNNNGISGNATVVKDGKYGLISAQGEIILDASYTQIKNVGWNNNLFVFIDDQQKMGLVDTQQNTIVIQPKYDSINYDVFSLFRVLLLSENNNKCLFDIDSGRISNCQYEQIDLISQDGLSKDKPYCFLGKHELKYDVVNSNLTVTATVPAEYYYPEVIASKKTFLRDINTDKILSGISLLVINEQEETELFSLSGDKYAIQPECVVFINGGAILKDVHGKFSILFDGRLYSYEEYNSEMKTDNYSRDKILPKWARMYYSGKDKTSSKSIMSLENGSLQLHYESIDLDGVNDLGGFGLTDSQGYWIVRPVLTTETNNSYGNWTLFPCDDIQSAIISHDGKYGRVNLFEKEGYFSMPFVFSSYKEAVKYRGYDMNDGYYAILGKEREDGFYVLGYANQDKLLIPPQYYCWWQGDLGYTFHSISPAGYVAVLPEPSYEDGKEIVINLDNEIVGPPDGLSAYEFIKKLNNPYDDIIENICRFIPDHGEADAEHLTSSYYKAYKEAVDAPSNYPFGIGDEEFLYYFVQGQEYTDLTFKINSVVEDGDKLIAEVNIIHTENGVPINDYGYREKNEEVHTVTVVKDSNGKYLLDDFDNTKQQCLNYIKKMRAQYKSGEIERLLRNEGATESEISQYQKSVQAYYSKYGGESSTKQGAKSNNVKPSTETQKRDMLIGSSSGGAITTRQTKSTTFSSALDVELYLQDNKFKNYDDGLVMTFGSNREMYVSDGVENHCISNALRIDSITSTRAILVGTSFTGAPVRLKVDCRAGTISTITTEIASETYHIIR